MATTTLSTPDPSHWLPLDAIGTVVTRGGRTYRVLGIYFAAGPEGQNHTLHQYWIGEEVNPQEIPRWYLVRTEPGREVVAERALEAAGTTVLLPRLYFEAPRNKARRRGRPKDTMPPATGSSPLPCLPLRPARPRRHRVLEQVAAGTGCRRSGGHGT